jgi:hypothetical protein
VNDARTPIVAPAGGPGDPRADLVGRWAERHGIEAARRLAQAEDLADAVAAEIVPAN